MPAEKAAKVTTLNRNVAAKIDMVIAKLGDPGRIHTSSVSD